MAWRKAPPRALSDAFRPILPLVEARGQQIYKGDGGLAARVPVDWRLDGSGRVWFAYARFVRPELLRRQSFGKLEFGL